MEYLQRQGRNISEAGKAYFRGGSNFAGSGKGESK